MAISVTRIKLNKKNKDFLRYLRAMETSQTTLYAQQKSLPHTKFNFVIYYVGTNKNSIKPDHQIKLFYFDRCEL